MIKFENGYLEHSAAEDATQVESDANFYKFKFRFYNLDNNLTNFIIRDFIKIYVNSNLAEIFV